MTNIPPSEAANNSNPTTDESLLSQTNTILSSIPTKKCKLYKAINFILLAFLLAACVLLSFLYYALLQSIEQLKEENVSIRNEQSTSVNSIAQLQLRLDDQQQALNKLNKTNQSLQSNEILFEIDYLLQMTNFVLQKQHDITSALHLIDFASQRLSTLPANPELGEINSNILQMRSVLQATLPVDSASILTQLGRIGLQINQLSLVASQPVAASSSPPKPDTSALDPSLSLIERWKEGLLATWEKIKNMVVIQFHSDSTISSSQRFDSAFIHQQLQFFLQQASWGVMNFNSEIYTTSLQQAIQWINQYYPSQSNLAKDIIYQLQELASIDLRPDYPDLTPLIKQVQAKIQFQQPAAVLPFKEKESNAILPPPAAQDNVVKDPL